LPMENPQGRGYAAKARQPSSTRGFEGRPIMSIGSEKPLG
jgi:hypothetical protein